MTDLVAQGLALVGGLLIFLAALGALRFRDLYTRMHAASKASSLGLGILMIAVALSAGEAATWIKAICGFLFLFLTSPVAAHLLGRAAYIHRIPLWKGSVVDDLAGKYAADHSRLEGIPRPD